MGFVRNSFPIFSLALCSAVILVSPLALGASQATFGPRFETVAKGVLKNQYLEAEKEVEQLLERSDLQSVLDSQVEVRVSDGVTAVVDEKTGKIHTISVGKFASLAEFKTGLMKLQGLLESSARGYLEGGESAVDNDADPAVAPRFSGHFLKPANGPYSSPFGYRLHPVLKVWRLHGGIDIAVVIGTPVFAGAPGVVKSAGWINGFGNAVEIDHGHGVLTIYGHLSKWLVHPGQAVTTNTEIALSGNTGLSSGPHLHFELRIGNVPIDPKPFIIARTPNAHADLGGGADPDESPSPAPAADYRGCKKQNSAVFEDFWCCTQAPKMVPADIMTLFKSRPVQGCPSGKVKKWPGASCGLNAAGTLKGDVWKCVK